MTDHENTPAAELAPVARERYADAGIAVNPATGEAIALAELGADELFHELDTVARFTDAMADYRRALEAELVRRADSRNERTVTLDGCDYTVNAPTEDVLEVAAIREQADLFEHRAGASRDAGDDEAAALLEQRAELLRRLIVTPPPTRPPERVDKRAFARLAKTDDRELLGALAAARRRVPAKRTVKLKARALNATAEEV